MIETRKDHPNFLLTKEQAERILDAIEDIKDKFIFLLFWESGIRKGEFFSLKHEDILVNENTIIRHSVKGRNYKDSNMYVSSNLMEVYKKYLEVYRIEPIPTNYIFIKKDRSLISCNCELITLFNKIFSETGIYVSTETIRRSYLKTLINSGIDMESFLAQAGFANIQRNKTYKVYFDFLSNNI